MTSGDKATRIHLVITFVVSYSVLVSWLFGPYLSSRESTDCLPLIKWIADTVIFPICIVPAILLAIILVFLKTLASLPFAAFYWCKRFNESTKSERLKGLILTIVAMSLVIMDPCIPFGFSNSIQKYLSSLDAESGVLNYFIAILSIYIIPCVFIHLGHPDNKRSKLYRLYIVSIIVQVLLFLLAVFDGILL